jgi:hypothetical protein
LSLIETIALALAGFLSGWINVIAGGGSLITVAAMTFIGMPGPVANGTNRIAVIAQSLSAVVAFFARGFSDFRLSLSLAAVASAGAVVGALIGVELSGVWFERTLALVMLAVLALMATEPKQQDATAVAATPRNLAAGHCLMALAGVWGGFIQIGVGFLMMPILYRVMGLDLVRVNMHKVFITFVMSIFALAVFAARVEIAWGAGAALALGTIAGGWLGAQSTMRRGAKLVRQVLFVMIIAMAAKLLFF